MNISHKALIIGSMLMLLLIFPIDGSAGNPTRPLSSLDLQTMDTLSAQDHRRALVQYTQRLRDNEYDYEARLGLARAYIQLGDLRQADREAEWFLARDRNSFGGLFIKGEVLFHQQRYIDAVTYLWLAELVNPDDALLQLRLYQTLQALGDSSGAAIALGRYEKLLAEQRRRESKAAAQPFDSDSFTDPSAAEAGDDNT